METYMFRLPPVVSVAFEVISGKYGVGEERLKALKKAGYDADLVQRCVNDLLTLFNKYGGE